MGHETSVLDCGSYLPMLATFTNYFLFTQLLLPLTLFSDVMADVLRSSSDPDFHFACDFGPF